MPEVRKSAIWLAAISLLMFGLSTCWSQTSTGGITGQVEDAQNAAVPAATVVIRSLQTNTVTKLLSNQEGIYSLTSLSAGTYSVTVDKSGFKQVVVNSVQVNIASMTKVDVVLPIGGVTETVSVEASDQLLNIENPTLTTVVPNHIVSSLPFPQQGSLEVATLVPGVQGDPQYDMGVQSEDPSVYTQPTTTGGSLAIGGGRPGSTEQLVDGFDVTMIGYARAGITFSANSINQVTVQSDGLSAQYGRTGGGIINQSTASGTSQYHGIVSYRHYDPFFEAATYGQGGLRQDAHQNIFSGAVGGPLPLPHIKNTFFFASYEPLRATTKLYTRARVPTPDELAGNFNNNLNLLNTSVLKSQGYAAAVAAPRTGGLAYEFPLNAAGFPFGAQYTSSSQYVPIPNNSVAAQLAQNPAAQYVLSLFPTPAHHTAFTQYINPDASYANDGNNVITSIGVADNDDRYDARIDHEFNSSDKMFVRYSNVPVSGARFNYLGPTSPMDPSQESKIDSQNAVVNFTHIFRNNIVNEARVSYLYMDYENSPAPAGLTQDFAAKLGLTPSVLGAGFPALGLDAGTVGGSTGGNDGGISLNESYAYGDDLSILVGKHTLTMGGEFRAMQLNRLSNANQYGGKYGFSNGLTAAAIGGGNATATFILGLSNSLAVQAAQKYYYRSKYGAAYIQDDWKIWPNLTLNLGLRYNLETPRTEKNGLQGRLLANYTGTLNGVAATGAFGYAGMNGVGKGLWPTNFKGFEPRVGFAYQPTHSTTVRASYGLIHAPLTGVTNSVIPSLLQPALRLGGTTGGKYSTANGYTNYYVDYITNPYTLPSTGLPGVLGPQAPVFNTNFAIPDIPQTDAVPYIEQWALSFQYQFHKNLLMEAAYSGQAGRQLFQQPVSENLVPLQTILAEVASNTNFNQGGFLNKYGLGSGNLNVNSQPYPQFPSGVSQMFGRWGTSSYNALYLSGSERLIGGLTLLSSFTWEKSMDDGSSGSEDSITTDTFGFASPQNPYAPYQGEHSLSLFDIPVHLTGAYVWDIPVGRGERVNVQNRILNEFAGGWSTSGIFTAESGYPAAINLGGPGWFITTAPGGNIGSNGSGSPYNLRPSFVPGQKLIQSNWKKDPYGLAGGGWLNPAAFAVPGMIGAPQLGNVPRTMGGARSPRTIYFDASAKKSFSITSSDRLKLAIKLDAINAFNHSDFFFNPNSGHSFEGNLANQTPTSATYTVAGGFGDLNSGSQSPGRVFALSANFTF